MSSGQSEDWLLAIIQRIAKWTSLRISRGRPQMTREYRFVQVDVFTERIFGGNPLAVFLDGRGIGDAEMQAIAREMNLSETTFILPPTDRAATGCVAKVRIFTPARELPFAGHPTI